MKIGIIGAGHIGGTLAKLFVAAGHEVAVSNSREPKTLAGLVEGLGDRARAMTPSEAERFDEVVIVSIPMGRYREVPTDAIGGKVVIDTNNYYPQRDGHPRSWTVTGRPPASCCKHTSQALVWSRRSTHSGGAGPPRRMTWGRAMRPDRDRASRRGSLASR